VSKKKLLPCKLCGGEAKISKTEKSEGQCHYDNWVIGCQYCGCHFCFAADGYYGREYISKEKAIEIWNTLHDRTVYVVTSGEYSAYGIEAVFTQEESATSYANLDSSRRVETYTSDNISVQFNGSQHMFEVTYDISEDKITHMSPTAKAFEREDHVAEYSLVEFVFCLVPSKHVYESIKKDSVNSKQLLKIARDRFAAYCVEHETSRQGLLDRKKKRDEERNRRYHLATTSIGDGLFNPYWHADRRMPTLMEAYHAEHGVYPDTETLRKMYDEQVEEVKKKLE